MLDGFQTLKLWLITFTGLGKDSLHVHVGLLIFFGSALVMRWSLRSWKPWAAVLFAALLGEAWDIRDTLVRDNPLFLRGNWKDLWNTMLWPSAILLLANTTRLFGPSRRT